MSSSCTRCSRSRVPWPVAPGRPAPATGTSSQARPWSCADQSTTRSTIAQGDQRPCPSRRAGTVLTTVRSCQPSGRAPLTGRSATAGPQVSGPGRARSRARCMSPGPLHRAEFVTRCAEGVPTARGRTPRAAGRGLARRRGVRPRARGWGPGSRRRAGSWSAALLTRTHATVADACAW